MHAALILVGLCASVLADPSVSLSGDQENRTRVLTRLFAKLETAPEELEHIVSAEAGSYSVTWKKTSEGSTSLWVCYPSSSKKFVLLSFAHGMTVTDARSAYSGTIAGVASQGYIIVALNGHAVDFGGEHKIQVAAIEHMRSSSYWKAKIDMSKKVGVFGHSMGGAATLNAAYDSISSGHIGAAVAMHPGGAPKGAPKVPTLYTTGTADTICAPAMVRSYYDRISKTHAHGFMEFSGYTHLSPSGPGSNKEIKWIHEWFGCYLYDHKSTCDDFYKNACHSGETSKCEVHHSAKMEKGAGVVVV